jgi:hypothetical protein
MSSSSSVPIRQDKTGKYKWPNIVLPFHDPHRLLYPYLQAITPQLKVLFQNAFVSISPATQARHPEIIDNLQKDPLFVVNMNPPGSLVGDHYRSGYQNAVEHVSAESILHLCDVDKVAFILLSEHRHRFLADIEWANKEKSPILFQRSERAWRTYPSNYRESESLVIQAGKILFHRYLDFAWSHLVIQAKVLQDLLPHIKSHDFGILIEMVLYLEKELQTKDVDWLAWENPFIYKRDAKLLQVEYERSEEETIKRLRGVIQFFPFLLDQMDILETEYKQTTTQTSS